MSARGINARQVGGEDYFLLVLLYIFEMWGDRYIVTLTLPHIHYSRHLYSITADLLTAVKGGY